MVNISDPRIHHSTSQHSTYFETSCPAVSTIRLAQCLANSGLCGVAICRKASGHKLWIVSVN